MREHPNRKGLTLLLCFTVPILFVQKKNKSGRLCRDYRGLNYLRILNKYLLPLISELLGKTSGRKWFTRMDLKNRYNLIGIAAVDKWKTVFCTNKEFFMYIVKTLVLTNIPTLFRGLIDTIFQVMEGCIWYLHNILIYSGNTEAKHQAIIEKVLQPGSNMNLQTISLQAKSRQQRPFFQGMSSMVKKSKQMSQNSKPGLNGQSPPRRQKCRHSQALLTTTVNSS